MVDRVDKKLSNRSVTEEGLYDFINRELVPVVEKLRLWTEAMGNRITEGTGSPEGVVTADIAALYLRQDGSPGTLLYIKTADDSNTGWSAIA